MIEPISFDISVPEEHPCFSDHFPEKPIVPGALMLQWLLQTTSQHLDNIRICSMPTIKFLAVLEPGDVFNVNLKPAKKIGRLKIVCTKQDAVILKGELSFIEEQG